LAGFPLIFPFTSSRQRGIPKTGYGQKKANVRPAPGAVWDMTFFFWSFAFAFFHTRLRGCLKKDKRRKTMTQNKDVYSRVTDKILADLEQGERPWMKPWNAEHAAGSITRPLRFNGLPYSGINVMMLWSEAMEKGYSAPIWMTFRQAQELGGHVKKGEHGSLVVYASTVHKTERDADSGEEIERDIPFMKGYTVFNVEQIEDLPAHYYAPAQAPALTLAERDEKLEAFFAATKADIRHGGNRAFYQITQDFVQMPPFEFFKDTESYYATLGHETCHWTRHPSRLDRDFGRKRWGDEGYAMEELVAELGSAYLCADLGITPEIRDDHSAYIASWLKVLQNDKRAIFTAAAHAQRAADFLHALQPTKELEAEPQENPQDENESDVRLEY
jgi:antirestriction protein ArdC